MIRYKEHRESFFFNQEVRVWRVKESEEETKESNE